MRRTRAFFPLGPIQIFLHEGLIDDAIALVDRDTYASAHLIEPVADAAIHSHPDWVIAASRRQAEPIMDRGKADKYGVAIQWLTKAREAHRAAGRQDDWNAYLDSLLTEHGRKYKLVPMLKTLQW
jgi:uncharacterized Zn finger protein